MDISSRFFLAACRFLLTGHRVALLKDNENIMDVLHLIHLDYHVCTVITMQRNKCFDDHHRHHRHHQYQQQQRM